MIAMARIDDRLVHGQVLVGCCGPLRATRVLLVNDRVAGDEFEASCYDAAVPPGLRLEVLAVSAAAARVAELAAVPAERCVVVVGDPGDMLRLVESGAPLDEVVLGGLHHRAGRDETWPGVYASAPEREQLRALLAHGVELVVQAVPGAPRHAPGEGLGGARP